MRYRQKLRVVASSCINQFTVSIGRATFRFCALVQPIVYGFILGMMYLNQSPEDFTIYVLFGSGIVTFWSTICFSSAGDINRERFYGTLENIFVAPSGFESIVLGKILGNTLWGIISMVISALFVSIFFSKPIILRHVGLFLVGFILMVASFVAIAFVLSGLFTLSRSARILMNCLEHPIYILCGIVFPVEILPGFIRGFSYLLSPTWAVRVLRLSVTGGSVGEIQFYLGGLFVITAVYIGFAKYLFGKIDKKARVEATLGVY